MYAQKSRVEVKNEKKEKCKHTTFMKEYSKFKNRKISVYPYLSIIIPEKHLNVDVFFFNLPKQKN